MIKLERQTRVIKQNEDTKIKKNSSTCQIK